MLFNEITNIISLSYSELGSIGLSIARNFNNGYGKSQKQKQLIKTARLIQMELKTVLDHVVYDDDGNVSYLIRSTDEQINKSLTYLIDLTEIQDYSTGPTLFHKLKPSRIYNTATILFQYSTDGLAWHDTYTSGDAYLRVSTDAGATWTDALLFYNNADDKVSKSGDTMSGNLVIPNGTIAGHAVNKGQLDDVVSAASADATNKADAAEDAAKSYADNLVLGLWDDRGNYNPNTNSNLYPNSGGSGVAGAVMDGDIWVINGLGVGVTTTIGTKTVQDGDSVRATVDSPGQTETNWAIIEANIGYAPVNKSGDTMSGNLAMGGNKVTGLAAAANPGEAVRFEQLPVAPTISGTPEILYKVLDIGDWNMDSNGSANVTVTGLDTSKIRSITGIVRSDPNYLGSGVTQIFAIGGYLASNVSTNGDLGFGQCYPSGGDSVIQIFRRDSSDFDSTEFNSTSYNRGWITVQYIP